MAKFRASALRYNKAPIRVTVTRDMRLPYINRILMRLFTGYSILTDVTCAQAPANDKDDGTLPILTRAAQHTRRARQAIHQGAAAALCKIAQARP